MKPYCFSFENDEGDEINLSVPGRWEICSECEGNGTLDNPAFSNGLSQEDFDEDPDFRENYFSGRYDVRCTHCDDGKRIVPDVSLCTYAEKRQLVAHRKYLERRARWTRESARERAMGY